MNFWRHIANYSKREANSDAGPREPRAGASQLWPYTGGNALAVGAVYRCVKLLSESVANLQVQSLKRRGEIFVEETGGQLWYLLNIEPDIALSAFDMWRQATVNVLLDGNAYIIPVYNPASMELDRLALCGRGSVSHDTISDTYYISDNVNGIFGTFREDEVIHWKGMTTTDPKNGVSVLEYARTTTRIATTGDRETLNRFANGGTVKGLVSNDRSVKGFGEYQDRQLEETAKDLNYRYNVNGENIVASPGQVAFTQISMSSVDMQFLESRKFTVRDICRFFGVHPSFVFDDTSNNYKSAEQANVAFLSHTLNPLLRGIEVELNRKLIPKGLSHKRRIQFDRRGIYACDLEGQMKYRGLLLQTGTSVNELRLMDNRTPVDGGDRVFISQNLRGIDENPSANAPVEPGEPEDKKKDDDNEKE